MFSLVAMMQGCSFFQNKEHQTDVVPLCPAIDRTKLAATPVPPRPSGWVDPTDYIESLERAVLSCNNDKEHAVSEVE